jgi:methylmalonyl-CoA mutase, N-terminal domain
VLGGTQSLHCNGRDEALALPTEESARIALRTQQIIAAESGVANTVDPFAGSYAIEQLTNDIERAAQATLDRIEQAGGTLAAIEAGMIQREIQESAYRAQLAVDAGDAIVVGVNQFAEGERESSTDPKRTPVPVFQVDPDIERRQVERVRALRAARNAAAWQQAIDAVARAAADGSNLVPPIVAAVEASATVGEVADAMRSVFGEFQEIATA